MVEAIFFRRRVNDAANNLHKHPLFWHARCRGERCLFTACKRNDLDFYSDSSAATECGSLQSQHIHSLKSYTSKNTGITGRGYDDGIRGGVFELNRKKTIFQEG